MEPEFITYQRFNDPALADELAEQLQQHNVEYYIEEESSGFDPSLAMGNEQKDYAVKIKSEDFEQVNKLLKAYEEENIDGIDKDYYLFGFTDDELMEVITKSEEWSTFDGVLARKLLAERGNVVSEEEISRMQEDKIEKLKQPEPPQHVYIILGYLFALLGGVLGFFIGWHLSSYKKTLPDGERVYGYTENDRRHGRLIFYLSFVGLAIGFAVKLLPAFQNN